MSSIRYEPSLSIEPKPSVTLKWFLIANFTGATLVLFVVYPALIALPLIALLWLYYLWLYQHHILQSTSTSIRLLVRETTGEWRLHTREGDAQEVTLSPSSYIHPHLIILILQAEGKRHTLLLLRDSLSEESFRALSVSLKMGRAIVSR